MLHMAQIVFKHQSRCVACLQWSLLPVPCVTCKSKNAELTVLLHCTHIIAERSPQAWTQTQLQLISTDCFTIKASLCFTVKLEPEMLGFALAYTALKQL